MKRKPDRARIISLLREIYQNPPVMRYTIFESIFTRLDKSRIAHRYAAKRKIFCFLEEFVADMSSLATNAEGIEERLKKMIKLAEMFHLRIEHSMLSCFFGGIKQLAGDISGAKMFYERAQIKCKKNAIAMFSLGEINSSNGIFSEALENFANAKNTFEWFLSKVQMPYNKNFVGLLFFRSGCLFMAQQKYEKALKDFLKSRRTRPHFPAIVYQYCAVDAWVQKKPKFGTELS